MPVTVSRLMLKYRSEKNLRKEKKVISAGIFLSVIISLPLSFILFFWHEKFNFLFTDDRCVAVFLTVAPALTFNSVYSVLRGVFWGNKDFLPYSITELLEEVVMIIAGIVLITNATSVLDGAKRAGLAVLISYVFSFTAGFIIFLRRGGRLVNPKGEVAPLLTSSLPITAMKTTSSLINSLVSIILPLRLVAGGLSGAEAVAAFGSAFGMAMPLLFVPTTLIGSFLLVLIPEISDHYYCGNKNYLKADVEKAVKLSVFISCMFIPVFLVLGDEIGILVFGDVESGARLSESAILTLPMGISALSTSILNSMGQEKKTLIYYFYAAFFMLACIWFLPLVIGIKALTVALFCLFFITSLLNLRLIKKISGVKPAYLRFIVLGFLFTIPSAVFGYFLESVLINYLGNLLTLLFVGISVTAFNLLLFIVFNAVDIKPILKNIPLFNRFYNGKKTYANNCVDRKHNRLERKTGK